MVKLNSSVGYLGVLACLHNYINIALEEMEGKWTTEEKISGYVYFRKMQYVICTLAHRGERCEDIKNTLHYFLYFDIFL